MKLITRPTTPYSHRENDENEFSGRLFPFMPANPRQSQLSLQEALIFHYFNNIASSACCLGSKMIEIHTEGSKYARLVQQGAFEKIS